MIAHHLTKLRSCQGFGHDIPYEFLCFALEADLIVSQSTEYCLLSGVFIFVRTLARGKDKLWSENLRVY